MKHDKEQALMDFQFEIPKIEIELHAEIKDSKRTGSQSPEVDKDDIGLFTPSKYKSDVSDFESSTWFVNIVLE